MFATETVVAETVVAETAVAEVARLEMKFFDRKEEISELRRIRNKSHTNAQFTVITGRRRVGKTELVRHAFEDEGYLYYYVSKKSQLDLCDSFRQITEQVLGVSVPGRIEHYRTFICCVGKNHAK